MILTDYFLHKKDMTWDIALQCGVNIGTVRLPDDMDFTSLEQLKEIVDNFKSYGITPKILEPLPNPLHDHIKLGDSLRDEAIDKFICLMKNMSALGMEMVCFNFMAHYGWTRTASSYPERGGAKVTGFELESFKPDKFSISRQKVWENYEYFIKRVIPYAEKYNIKLALHPDDPPLEKLGNVGRIFTNTEAIRKGMSVVDSPMLGLTFCQATYYLMGANLEDRIKEFADKIFFIHFRNTRGTKEKFYETHHDNGEIDMAEILYYYIKNGISVPVRVDHVPTLVGENSELGGYDALGRLFAIGYLKGIIQATKNLLKAKEK